MFSSFRIGNAIVVASLGSYRKISPPKLDISGAFGALSVDLDCSLGRSDCPTEGVLGALKMTVS
jgi:hypothetical protein